MAINTLEAAKIFQVALDQQVLEGATSGWMEQNAGQVKYSGGNEIKIPKMSLSGLGNYDRDAGYTQGAVSLTYETKTMTMDRGSKFLRVFRRRTGSRRAVRRINSRFHRATS